MTNTEAIQFLSQWQPMPNDDDLSEELIQRYDIARQHFIEHPDERCIPLFLNSFGEGDGLGVYQLVEDVLRKYTPDRVVPHLIVGLQSGRRGVRYWNAEIAAIFPDVNLVPALSTLLDGGDPDVRSAAAIALGQIRHPDARKVLEQRLRGESDEHVKTVIRGQIT